MRYLIMMIIVLSSINATSADESMKLKIDNIIRAAEIKYDLPQGILAALVHVESSGNHKVVVELDGTSNASSYGLTQIQLDAARFIQRSKAEDNRVKLNKKDLVKASDLLIPEINVDYGGAYLKWMLDTHRNDLAWALSCYNAGPNSYICKHKKYSPYVGLVFNAYMKKLNK